MARHEFIGHEGEVPFLGVWMRGRRPVGVYLRTRWVRFYAGSMFGRPVLQIPPRPFA